MWMRFLAHFDFASTSCCLQYNCTSMSFRVGFASTLSSCFVERDFAPMRFRYICYADSISRGFIQTSFRVHFDTAPNPLRMHLVFASVSLWCHFGFISCSPRFSRGLSMESEQNRDLVFSQVLVYLLAFDMPSIGLSTQASRQASRQAS